MPLPGAHAGRSLPSRLERAGRMAKWGCKMTLGWKAALLAGLTGAAALAGAAEATELRTWYIYCEARVNGKPSAIFSANLWPHEASNAYQRELASAAERYISGSPGTELAGCAGIPFHDQAIALHNRDKTANMARDIGDAVYYVEMPTAVLPD